MMPRLTQTHTHIHTHTQTPDSKKEEFRKYLEKNGVIDALTKGVCVCVCLCVYVVYVGGDCFKWEGSVWVGRLVGVCMCAGVW
jgi:hypothetical protein